MRQQGRLKRNIAAHAPNHKAVQGFAHLGNGVRPVFAMHDQLGNHRVIKHWNLAAVLHPGVHAHALPLAGVGGKHGLQRWLKANQPTRGRQKIAKRVFGIDAALNGPAIAFDLSLRQRQLLTSGHPNHQLHQIQPGDALRHRVLHLQARVHLQKVKTLVFAHHKLHCAGALVVHGLGQLHRLLAHGLAGGLRDEG